MEWCILDLMPISRSLNEAVLAVDVNGQMKPCLNGEKCDIQHILSIGSNYVSKPPAIFNALGVPFFQFMHSYTVGVQMLLQHLLSAVPIYMNTKNDTVLLFVV
jgi:hypothetical protein